MTIAQRAEAHEIENGVGDYWWLSLLRALTGVGKDEEQASEAPIDHSKIQWL